MIDLNATFIARREYINRYRADAIVYMDDENALFSLDLHGFGSNSCIEALNLFIDEAIMLKSGQANVIHGNGAVLSVLVPEILESKGLRFDQRHGYVTIYMKGGRSEFGIITKADLDEQTGLEQHEKEGSSKESEFQAWYEEYMRELELRKEQVKRRNEAEKTEAEQVAKQVAVQTEAERIERERAEDEKLARGCLIILIIIIAYIVMAIITW